MALLNISMEVGTRQMEILNDFCAYHGRPDTVTNAEGNAVPNPEAKGPFMKRTVINFIKESVQAYRANQTAEAARLASVADTETNIVIS